MCTVYIKYTICNHKTIHKGHFFKIEIYTSSGGWINKLSIDVWKVCMYLLGLDDVDMHLFENLEFKGSK